jgi:hypothetical protein
MRPATVQLAGPGDDMSRRLPKPMLIVALSTLILAVVLAR